MNAIPRGGAIEVVVTEVTGMSDAPTVAFTLKAKGLNARIPPHAEALLAGSPEGGTVDAHGVQTYYAGLVARAAGMSVLLSLTGDEVTIRAASDVDQ
jgi:histidine phosphotransferase ChpT